MITFIGALTFIFGMMAFFAATKWSIFAFAAFSCLGSSAALQLGGLAVTPGVVTSLIFVASIVLSGYIKERTISSLQFPDFGFWYAVLLLYALASAIFFPRVFTGLTEVNPIGTTEFEPSLVPIPLRPSSGNLTQSAYMLLSTSVLFSFYSFCFNKKNLVWVCRAILCSSILNILFGIVDLATFYSRTAFILDPIRNGTYALHVDETLAGMKRIVGSYPETSSFSAVTLANLAFTRKLPSGLFSPNIIIPVNLLQIMLLVLSTSSTAYLGLIALALIYFGESFWELRPNSTSSTSVTRVAALISLVLIMVIVVLSIPEARDQFYDLVSATLLEKNTTDSGIERQAWNAQALQNFFDTYGIGVGLGSARASSFVLALASNLGLIGLVSYFCIGVLLFYSRESIEDGDVASMRSGARYSCAFMLIPSIISGTMVDLGGVFGMFAGVAFASNRLGSTSA